MQSGLKIVFAIVYKEILHLTMLDNLLDLMMLDFEANVLPDLTIKGGVYLSLPANYDQRFEEIMRKWQEDKQKALSNNTKDGDKAP